MSASEGLLSILVSKISVLLHRIATAEELEAANAPYVRKYIRVSFSISFRIKKKVHLTIISILTIEDCINSFIRSAFMNKIGKNVEVFVNTPPK